MFSGTGFITKDGRPAIIYHGQGSGKNQLAFALDDNLEKWTRPVAIEPIGKVPGLRPWDPDCFLRNDTYYAIFGGQNARLLKSTDLKNWDYVGLLLHDDMPKTLGVAKEEDISCPNMFKIGNKWMLLCISHRLGCRYYLGDFKGEQYLPEFHAFMNWKGWEFFAPESVLTEDGRRVMWAWCLINPGKDVPLQASIQSLPRELSLPEDGVLRIKPLRELETLRSDEKRETDLTVKSDGIYRLKEIAGDAIELKAAFGPSTAKQYGVHVYCDGRGNGGFPITVEPQAKTLTLGGMKVPFALKPGEDLTLRVFLDKSLIEVFANDRQAAVAPFNYAPGNLGVSIVGRGGDAAVKEVTGWKMKSIY